MVFSVTGGTSHSTPVTGLMDGQSYTYYVRCADLDGEFTDSDYVLDFSVADPGAAPVGDRAVWQLDEGVDVFAFDLSGQNNTGLLVNGPAWTTGRSGQALRFDGAAGYVSIPDSASLDYSSMPAASVALWVKPERLGHADEQTLYGQWNSSSSSRPFQILLLSNNRIECRTNNKSGVIESTSQMALDTWAHVACVWSPAGLKVYVNGVLEGTDGGVRGSLAGNSNVHTLGVRDKSGALSQFYQGLLDEIHIFGRELTAQEVQALYFAAP
jgi:hypothetical protein